MDYEQLVKAVNEFGFPVVASGGMSYIIYFIWVWATTTVKPLLTEANDTLIELVDRIRVLDNDMIRLRQKINTVLMLRKKQ